jgi:hypothetical protein
LMQTRDHFVPISITAILSRKTQTLSRDQPITLSEVISKVEFPV